MPSRNILLCVTGLSPQIVTETLYALAVAKSPAWLPDEIRVLTTATGRREAELNLLAPQPGGEPGWFHRLLRDYRLPDIAFDVSHIHVLADADGGALDDIRTPEDNEHAADFITDVVRDLTRDDASTLHVSIAGGRKTMGYYLGYALSLYGRAHDSLSHVLVSEPFENNRGFYYPTPYSMPISVRRGDKELTFDARDGRVELAEIPFVRLREGLPGSLLAGQARFSEAVSAVQKAFVPVSIALHPARREIIAAGAVVSLPPIEFAVYWTYAERRANALPGLHWSDADFGPAVLERYRRLVGAHSAEFERAEAAWQRATKETVDPVHSRIRKKLTAALGAWRALPYLPTRQGRIARTHYHRVGLELPPAAIHIEAASLPSPDMPPESA